MRKISKYTTAQDTDLRGLDKRVNTLIEMGYQPYGSPYSASNGRSAALCQALVKFEGDDQGDAKTAAAKPKLPVALTPPPPGLKPSLAPKPASAPTQPKPTPAPTPPAPPPTLPKTKQAPAPSTQKNSGAAARLAETSRGAGGSASGGPLAGIARSSQ